MACKIETFLNRAKTVRNTQELRDSRPGSSRPGLDEPCWEIAMCVGNSSFFFFAFIAHFSVPYTAERSRTTMSASAVAYFANSPRSGPAYTHSVNNVTLCKASLSYLFLLFFQRATWVGHTPTVRNFVYFRPTEHLLLSFTFKWRCLRFCNRISLKSHCRYSVIPGKRLSLISDRALNVVKCRTRGQAAR